MFVSTVLFAICAVFAATEARPNADNSDLAKGMSSFAADFYHECAQSKPGENVIVSSLSVASILALLSQGANGNTFEQLRTGLRLTGDKTSVADQFQEYHNLLLSSTSNSTTLSIANQIYVQQGYSVKQQFQDVAVQKFSSGIESLDFEKNDESANTINRFVKDKTNNKIKKIINPDMLNSDTRMVLVNAIHFKGKWEHPFSKEKTRPDDFYLSETEKTSVDFMHIKKHFKYSVVNDLDATALEMNYANSSFSFLVILPNSRDGLPALENKLKNHDLSTVTDRMHFNLVDVTIPKFKVEFATQLNDVLKNIGMDEMFSEQADLSGILESDEPLQVTEVVHKAFIEVNEEGTEAAAATAVLVGRLTSVNRPQITYFRADHPFVYYIRDTVKNTNIFSGRLQKF